MEAHARNTDPDTSHEAAEAIAPRIAQVQAAVLRFAALCGGRGFTDLDLNAHFASGSSTYRSRRAELVGLGLVEDSGIRTGNGKGRKHALWRITEAGMAQAGAPMRHAA